MIRNKSSETVPVEQSGQHTVEEGGRASDRMLAVGTAPTGGFGDMNDPGWAGYDQKLSEERTQPASSGATEPDYRQVICPDCGGTGKAFVHAEPVTLEDLEG